MNLRRISSIAFFIFTLSLSVHGAAYAQNAESFVTDSDEAAPAPIKGVVLEANVVQIILNDEHRDGVDWSAIVSDYHSVNLKKEDNSIWTDKKYKLSVGTVSDDDYAVLLDALDTVGHMTQFAQTPITVPIGPVTEGYLKMGSDDPSQDIRLNLQLSKLKSLENSLGIEEHLALITKNTKTPESLALKAQTDVLLKDNETIVIGGLIQEEEITKTHKFPVLGDLPLLDLVFRSQGRLMQKTETVIFLTVRTKAVDAQPEKTE